MLFFTLCHINQLPQAHLLGDSIRAHQPDADFFIGLIDRTERIPADFKATYKIVSVDALNIPAFETMSAKYNVGELLSDCKPFFAAHALRNADKIIYVDCTSILYNSVDFISNDLDNYNIILVPQLLHAGVHPDEKQTLNTGIFHAGFMGLKKSAETNRFVEWWGNNTTQKGYTNLCIGFNADQLWLEHVPNFYNKVLIQKHNGLNVGMWNLPEREIDFSANTVNGQPLISVNFKGMKYWPVYKKKLKQYAIKEVAPAYGLSYPRDNKSGKKIARNIRKFNSLVDKIIDLLQ